MKLACTILLLFCSHLAVGSDGNSVRARQLQAPSSCNQKPNQESCFGAVDDLTGNQCEWCIAGAVPSECMSQEQASSLPKGVFDCITPGSSSVDSKPSTTSTEFQFAERNGGTRTYQLRMKENEQDVSDLCDSQSKSISGYMDIKGSEYDANGENKHLFFWMFEKRGGGNETTPFMVWLTGGPGCSSTLALLTENGPCTVAKDGTSTVLNPYSWTESAHVLWLDQPAGVGFSYGEETDTDEKMISEDAYYFLQAFFQTYKEYQSNPLFIVGESYGGHYAPAIAHRVWLGNKAGKANTIPLKLSGLGIGNGLTDPEHQYPYYVDILTNNSHGIKIVDDDTAAAMAEVVPKCVELIQYCNAGDNVMNRFACQSGFLVCNAGLTSPYRMTGLNPYDFRIPCEVPPLCYDMSSVEHFLNLESTKQALHVDEKHTHSWESCNFGINMKFHVDWMHDFSGYVADLLNDGIPALIYAGDVDFVCNYLGNRAWTLALEWDGKDDFNNAPENDWKGQGLARAAKGLTFLQVYDAGHMVPKDQPEVALEMITNFMTGASF